MDERTKRLVGEQVEPGGRQKAPGRLSLLQRFVNTWNHDFPAAWDRLRDGARAGRWLRAAGLIARGAPLSSAQAARLRDFREALRDVIRAGLEQRVSDDTMRRLRAVSTAATLRVQLDDRGHTRLTAARAGVEGIAAELLAIAHEAQQTGMWMRLKACRHCRYVFYDRSKNRSAVWCAMAICGNRAKSRAYRRRLAARPREGP